MPLHKMNDYQKVFSASFRRLTYADYIKTYILDRSDLSDEQLVAAIMACAPQGCSVTEAQVQKLLATRQRCNAGVIPMVLTEQGNYLIAGVSQRVGKQKRGALVNAMGGVEDEDATLADAALRELSEELGTVIGNAFSPNQKTALCNVYSRLGETFEEAARNIFAYLSGQRRSISLFANMVIAKRMTLAEFSQLGHVANKQLAKLATKYADLCALRYPKNQCHNKITPQHITEYFQFLRTIENELPSFVIEALRPKVQRCEQTGAPADLVPILDILIDVTENQCVIPVSSHELVRLCSQLSQTDGALITGVTANNETVEFFKPSVTDAAALIVKQGGVEDLFRELDQQLPMNMPKRVNTAYQAVLKQITTTARFPFQGISKPKGYRGVFIEHAADICLSLITASANLNPRGLSHEGQQQLALGELYHQHSLKDGAFLKPEEIPSHVSAAQTDERIANCVIRKGARLYQFVRPGGYIGDYYAGDSEATAEDCGTSARVTDPNDAQRIVDRVKLTLVVVDENGFDARLSTAKPVDDFWSIKNQRVHCAGGGEQYYMPLPLSLRQSGLVLLNTGNPADHPALQAVATANKLPIMTPAALQQHHGIAELTEPYSRDAVFDNPQIAARDFHTLQRDANEAIKLGQLQMATVYLNYALNKFGVSRHNKMVLKCVLACLYTAVGQHGRANNIREACFEYFQAIINEDAENNGPLIKLAFLSEFTRIRAIEKTSESIVELLRLRNQLNNEVLKFAFSEAELTSLSALFDLDLAIKYNRIASQFSDEITYHDFDSSGERTNRKVTYAELANKHCISALKSKALSVQETTTCWIELAYSLHKQKNNAGAINLLLSTADRLSTFISQVEDDFSRQAIEDCQLQLSGVKLAIGLNLARLQKSPESLEDIPEAMREVNPVTYLLQLSDELKTYPPMKVKLLFNRWVGPNANNLFMEGWFRLKGQHNVQQGSLLIGLYRQFIPLEIEKICRDLKSNRIEELDLAYLGMREPAGISDDEFYKLADAIANNTSLKKLFIRKFSRRLSESEKSAAIQTNDLKPFRAKVLFDALATAHTKGQRLTYLSYSGARFNHPIEFESTLNYLQTAQSIKILQPALYDWRDEQCIKQFAEMVANHQSLTTILTGIFKGKDAGKQLYQAGKISGTLRHVYPFPGNISDDPIDPAKVNNTWLLRLQSELNLFHNPPSPPTSEDNDEFDDNDDDDVFDVVGDDPDENEHDDIDQHYEAAEHDGCKRRCL